MVQNQKQNNEFNNQNQSFRLNYRFILENCYTTTPYYYVMYPRTSTLTQCGEGGAWQGWVQCPHESSRSLWRSDVLSVGGSSGGHPITVEDVSD